MSRIQMRYYCCVVPHEVLLLLRGLIDWLESIGA